jgi:hypothetical protein
MKPFGQKPEKRKGKVDGHTADTCGICSNHGWKLAKARGRKKHAFSNALFESFEQLTERQQDEVLETICKPL